MHSWKSEQSQGTYLVWRQASNKLWLTVFIWSHLNYTICNCTYKYSQQTTHKNRPMTIYGKFTLTWHFYVCVRTYLWVLLHIPNSWTDRHCILNANNNDNKKRITMLLILLSLLLGTSQPDHWLCTQPQAAIMAHSLPVSSCLLFWLALILPLARYHASTV